MARNEAVIERLDELASQADRPVGLDDAEVLAGPASEAMRRQ